MADGVEQETAVSAVQNEAKGINPLRWIGCLFFRPRKFFTELADGAGPLTVGLSVFLLGLLFGLMEYGMTQPGHITDDPLKFVWHIVAGMVVAGPAIYLLMGSLYGLRLRLCRPSGLTWKGARRVFLFSAVVMVLPTISILLLCRTTDFARPHSAALAVMVFGVSVIWSLVVSYIGVLAKYRPFPLRSALFFLVVPLLGYVGLFWGSYTYNPTRPNVDETRFYQGTNISFRYPGNWIVKESEELGTETIMVRDPRERAVFTFYVIDSDAPPSEFVERMYTDMPFDAKVRLSELRIDPRTKESELLFGFVECGHKWTARVRAKEVNAQTRLVAFQSSPTVLKDDFQRAFDLILRSARMTKAGH